MFLRTSLLYAWLIVALLACGGGDGADYPGSGNTVGAGGAGAGAGFGSTASATGTSGDNPTGGGAAAGTTGGGSAGIPTAGATGDAGSSNPGGNDAAGAGGTNDDPRPTPAAPPPDCTMDVQKLVDAAAAGTTVTVSGCTVRATITINKPLTLAATNGAEIRGSDVWTSWTKSGANWSHGPVPVFKSGGPTCMDNGLRCQWPEQVFRDGMPLAQVSANPKSGQFALDAARNVILADDPSGHLLEVTTRTRWVLGAADGVTVQGWTMRHAAPRSQDAAFSNAGHSNWTVQDCVFTDAHAANVNLGAAFGQVNKRVTGLALLRSEIAYGGQTGLHSSFADLAVRGNHIHHNNTEGFDPGYEAGGMKTTNMTSMVVDNNEVDGNAGAGMWCDIYCGAGGPASINYANNRIHHNLQAGIEYEVSSNATIHDNVLFENGWRNTSGTNGAGILVYFSENVEVYSNTVAWSGEGIGVLSGPRDDYPDRGLPTSVHDIDFHDNTVLSAGTKGMLFITNFTNDDTMFLPAQNNVGQDNSFWYPNAEADSQKRFDYGTPFAYIADFAATRGGTRSTYLSDADKNALITSLKLPVMSSH